MLMDYKKVLSFLKRLNDYSLRVYGLNLCEIDLNGSKSVLEYLYDRSEYANKFKSYKEEASFLLSKNSGIDLSYLQAKYFPDIDLSRSPNKMSDDDLFNFINLTGSNQMHDFLIIRYNEIRIFNNKIVTCAPWNCYDGLLREMRSIVLDIRNFKVVSLPFYKFMNMGESVDYSLDSILNRLNHSSFVEYADKIDGSFIQITCLDNKPYFYPYDTLLTTSKNLRNTDIYKIARNWYESHPNYKMLVYAYPEWTLMFESISMEDRHIVVYRPEQCGLYLIGMRHKVTGELKSYAELQFIASNYGVWTVDTYSGSFDDIRKSLSVYKSDEKEGYVMNIDGFLVKLKCSDYLDMVSILKADASPNVVIRSISMNSLDDLISRLPDLHKERAMWYADEVYEYLDLMSNLIDSFVDYLLSLNLSIKEVGILLNKVPKLYRGSVSLMYFTLVKKGYRPQTDYLQVNSSKGNNGYINMTELRRRLDVLRSIDIDSYVVSVFSK